MADGQLTVELRAQITNYVNGMREASKETKSTENVVDKASGNIKNALLGAFSIGSIVAFGKAVVDATAEYQKFGAVLGNTLGSSALANLKLKELQDFAAKTPFSVNELTASYVKLANAGFKPNSEQLTKLGDLASSTGKSFDQLAEAILDAQSGEFERLKEFGVRSKDAGDSVIFTYKGVQTQVEKTSGAIRDYITALGGAEGTSGAMAVISETLGGKISNLGDSWDQMLISVGKNTSGVFSDSIDIISVAIGKVTEFNQELDIASKYKIGNGFKDALETLYKYSAGGLAGGAQQTTTEKLVADVINAQNAVGSFVSKAVSGAKSATDFGKALAQLKKDGDKTLKGISDPGVLQGVSDAYQEGVKAIQAARNNFNKSATTPDSNFGKGGADKKIKSVSDILKELDANLRVTENQFGSTFDEKTESAIRNYQTAINELAKKGTPDAIAEISKLNEVLARTRVLSQNIQLGGSISDLANQAADQSFKYNSQGQQGSGGIVVKDDNLNLFKKQLTDKAKLVTANQKFILDNTKDFNEQFTALTSLSAISEGLGSAFEGIGQSLAAGASIIEAAGNAAKAAFGTIIAAFGDQLIQMGVAKIAAAALVTPFGAALAAQGAGLVALGAGLKVAGGFVGSSNSGNGKQGNNVTAFANGGVVYGPTNALIGEYAGAKSDPEVVAPLSKLKSIIGKGTGDNPVNNQTVQVGIEGIVKGKDLVLITKRVNESRT